MAVSLEPRANRRTWVRVNQIPPDKATPVPRGAGAPLGTVPRLSRRCGIAALARLAPLALLLLLAAGRGSEQGRRWAAPVDARHAGRVPALPPTAARSLHPSKAVTSNTAPRSRRAIRPECPPTVERRGHLLFRRQDLPGALFARTRHRSGWRRLAVAVVASLRGAALPRSLRAQPSRHGEAPCHAGCFALRSRMRSRSLFTESPSGSGGFRLKSVLSLQYSRSRRTLSGASPTSRYTSVRMRMSENVRPF